MKFMYQHQQILSAAKFLAKRNPKIGDENEYVERIKKDIDRMVKAVEKERIKDKYDWRITGSCGYSIVVQMADKDCAGIDVLVNPAIGKEIIVEYLK